MKEIIQEIGKCLEKMSILRRIEHHRLAEASGLYFGQPPVLNYIIHHPGCSQTDLAREMHVTPASIAQSTKRLQKSGLIEKKVDPDNLRANKLYVTPAGIAASEQSWNQMQAFEAATLEGFSKEELMQLCGYLHRIIGNAAGAMGIQADFRSIVELDQQVFNDSMKARKQEDEEV